MQKRDGQNRFRIKNISLITIWIASLDKQINFILLITQS